MIHLKDGRGIIVDYYPKKLPLRTELVYEDGSKVPFLPVSAKKDKQPRILPLEPTYRTMRQDPTLGPGVGSHHFSFRIEEVSFNHKPHHGFKLEVTPTFASGIKDVAGGLMEETIIVKSRPPYDPNVEKNASIGGRSTILQKAIGGIPVLICGTKSKSEESKSPCKPARKPTRTAMTTNKTASESINLFKIDDSNQSIQLEERDETLLFTGSGDKCLACGENLEAGQGLDPMEHKLDCRLFMTLGPLMMKSNRASTGKGNDVHGGAMSAKKEHDAYV